MTGTADDWISDEAIARIEAGTAPASPKKRTKAPLRPVDQLTADLEQAPPAAAPGEGLDPPDDGPDGRFDAPPREDPEPGDPGPPPSPPPRRPSRPKGQIWDGCPVKALGVHGDTSYFLDVLGQLRGVTKIERTKIMHLFGDKYDQLCRAFPQLGAPREDEPPKPKAGKFEGDAAASAMTQAAAEQGLIDPDRVVRGPGAWSDEDGGLIYHTGDQVIVGGRARKPDRIGDYIYPAAPSIPHPAKTVKPGDDPVASTAEVLATWKWRRPDIDPMIATGMLGCQMMGGALSWRPQFWITGPKSAGKSDLQKLLESLQGGEYGVIKAEDASPASIANALRISTLPVALDELEATDTGSVKERGIVEIMRIASSGGHRTRSGPDQSLSRTVLRSTFVASSIIIPGILSPQDKSRLIILDLDPFEGGETKPDLRPSVWRARGAQIKRLLIDRWPSWTERLELWRLAFRNEGGFSSRDEDNYATICAMADMMEREALPTPEVMAGIIARVAPQVRGALDHGSDSDSLLVHLLGQIYDPFRRGAQYTIGQWLMVAGDLDGAPEALRGSLAGSELDTYKNPRERAAEAANAALAPLLIRVSVRDKAQGPVLFVGNAKVPPLQQVFRDTVWHGGAWTQSLSRIKGAYSRIDGKYVSRTLAGTSSKGIEVPFSSIPGLAVFPQDRARTQPPEPTLPPDMEDFA